MVSPRGTGYRTIADALRAEIDSGGLPPGSRLPSENELMATYGVEQPTARRALDVLKNEGLIVARRGSGTFVRDFRLYRRRSPDHVAAALDLADGEQALVRRRRYLVDDVPVQLATSYFPARLVHGSRIAETDTGPGGAYARLAELGHKPVHFREELRARMPRESEAKLLDLTQGTPVIAVARTAYTEDGRAVEVNEMVLDAGSYLLEYGFSAG